MRIFKDCMEMVREVERDLHEMGVINPAETVQDKVVKGNPDFDTKELIGYSYCLRNFIDMDSMLEYFKIPLDYCKAEFRERTSCLPINPGEAYRFRPEIWKEFLHEGRFAYTYNERMRDRMWGQGDVKSVIQQLKEFPNTRQAIISLFDPCKDYPNMGAKSRIPCSMYYQFIQRSGRLSLIYNMRSCDFKTHFAVDAWMGIALLKYVSKMIEVPAGEFIHFCGSLHAFKKDGKDVF